MFDLVEATTSLAHLAVGLLSLGTMLVEGRLGLLAAGLPSSLATQLAQCLLSLACLAVGLLRTGHCGLDGQPEGLDVGLIICLFLLHVLTLGLGLRRRRVRTTTRTKLHPGFPQELLP